MEQDKLQWLQQIFDTTMSEYNVTKADAKLIWKSLSELSDKQDYYNFDFVYFMLQNLIKIPDYDNLRESSQFVYRIFLSIDYQFLISTEQKSLARLNQESVFCPTSSLYKDLMNLPLGLEPDNYEQWQAKYVSDIVKSGANYVSLRKEEFKELSKTDRRIYSNSYLKEIFEANARKNIKRSLYKMSKGWNY